MTDVFISYAREREGEAQRIAEALRHLGYGVWRDADIPAHRAFGEAIEERLAAARVVLVLWSAEAAKSEWVRSEASRARAMGKLVQLTLDKSPLPMPFDQIQCADLARWSGDSDAAGWRKVVASIGDLMGGPMGTVAPAAIQAAAPLSLPDKPSIAVLPFTNITGGKDEDYFSDGMLEEIVTSLSRFPELFVIAGGSSLAYRGDSRGRGQIARELGVRFILDGSVRRSGPRVRIAVNLADAVEGAQVWAERFDGTLEDVFALQDEVAAAVAGQIAPSIEAADIRRAHARPTSDLNAYDLYLRAAHRERDLDRQAIVDTLALLDQALALDPNYARALALAGLMRSVPQLFGLDEDLEESRRQALGLARRAMTAGADDPDVLAIVSNILLWSGEDVAAADALAERALARNPGASFAWWASAWVKLFDGRPALALDHWHTHLRLDPRSPFQAFIKGGMGLGLVLLGRFDEAVPLLKQANHLLAIHPFYVVAIAVAHARQGLVGEAAQDLRAIAVGQMRLVLGLLRNPDHRELIRAGLALAGAMSEIFISYARSREGEALRGLDYGVWLDDELPVHRSFSDVLEERLKMAKAVVVVWLSEAAKSDARSRARRSPRMRQGGQ